jgi:hypothetical protein
VPAPTPADIAKYVIYADFYSLALNGLFFDYSLSHIMLYVSCCFLPFLYDFPGRSLNFKRTSRPCPKEEGGRFCDI